MTKRILIFIFLLVAVADLTAVGVFLHGRWKTPPSACDPETPGKGYLEIKSELALSEGQTERFLAFRKTHHAALQAFSAKQSELQDALIDELRKDEPQAAHLDEIVTQINRLQREAQDNVVEHLQNMKNLLTPSQKDKFFDIIGRRMHAGAGPAGSSRFLKRP